ncbi:MAG: energy transducer TonB [Pseudomonadota bacterium]
MYRPVPSPRERAATVGLVILLHLAIAFALLNLSGTVRLAPPDALTQLIDVNVEPPPPIVTTEPETEKAKKAEGAASAKNIESEATPVVAPEPMIPVPSPNPITASPTPRQGAEATQGAADVVGPGTGAGGSGTGTGSGGAGNGPGGGGNGFAVVRTRLATRPLTRRDFTPDMLDRWPRGRPVNMRFRVDAEGRIIQCIVDIGTGDAQLDSTVCATAQARLRFYPGMNRDGQRVADWAGYGQRPLN